MFIMKNAVKSVLGRAISANRNSFTGLIKTRSLINTQINSFANQNEDEKFKEFVDLSKIDKKSFSNMSRDE